VVCVANCFTDLINSDEDEMILAATSEIAPLIVISSDKEQDDVEGNDLYLF